MGFLDDLKGWFTREATDAKEWVDDSVAGGHAGLDRAERKLAMTPEERLQANLDEIAASEDAFAEIQAKADAASARPLADRELAEQEVAGWGAEGPPPGPAGPVGSVGSVGSVGDAPEAPEAPPTG